MSIAKSLIIILLVAELFATIHRDINGRPAKSPTGFEGVVATIILAALQAWLFYAAGIFNIYS